jgi:hypothetical protein
MKTKLLRKVRKRFEIFHLPNGDNEHYNYNLFRLDDNKKSHFYARYAQLGRMKTGNQWCTDIFETEKECIEYLKSIILNRLRREGHKGRRDKTFIIQKKVWSV